MQVQDIKRVLEQQKDNAQMALNAIDALLEHSQKQSDEIRKLKEQLNDKKD